MKKGMSKAASFSRWSLLMGVACGLAMLPAANRAARGESIDITIVANGTPIPVPPPTGASSQTFGTTDLTLLNAELVAAGSAYQFQGLDGSSNWSGAPGGGTLSLGGIISIPVGTPSTTSTSLTITETETGFISPSGFSGTLTSSSGGSYSFAGPPNFQTANSSFNGISVSPLGYKVASAHGGIADSESVNFPPLSIPFSTPYTLTNVISFSLVPSTLGPTDTFSVVATVTAIPEPASVVTMLIGLPLPLVGLAWLRRRRAVVLNS
jgi:hypothetical protein